MPRTRKSVHPLKYQEVSNRNFLSLVGFKFLLERCPKVDFYCNQANIPDLTLGTAVQMILNSNFNASVKVKFRDLFPVSLSGIPFNSTLEDQQYFTAQATFKYTMFDVIDVNGKKV